MTEFHINVFKIKEIEDHPNADRLSLIRVFGGYPCLVRKDEFNVGDLAVYIPVDSTLPDTHQFSFLSPNDRKRLKAKRLRGIFSMGLVIPAPENTKENDDVAELLGIEKYIEPEPMMLGGECEKAPETWVFQKYTDIEPLRKNMHLLQEGENVVLTEKLHGANYRIVYKDNRLWVGSRNQIKKCIKNSTWWNIVEKLNLETKLKHYPDHIFYGELFGLGVQDLHYGLKETNFRIFDIFDLNSCRYLDHEEIVKITNLIQIEMVPILYKGPWKQELLSLCEGKTLLGEKNVREGFVVKPVKEKYNDSIGRVILKMHGEGYLLRKQRK